MLSKELFIKRMNLIQKFHSEQETLGETIQKLVDGWVVVNFGGHLVDEIIDMLNEALDIEDRDLLAWWLYEDVDKFIYDEKNNKISVITLKELYDFIIGK